METLKKKRLAHLGVLASLLATLAGSLTAVPAQAVTATPTAACSNGSCTVTFDYSGDYYLFSVPAGVRTMSFDAYGAQGGHSGGLGGKVSGQFTSIPSSLYVYVGGAGLSGSGKAGGFNGGGISGVGHGDEGSGGGSTDIRLSTLSSDRIIVAGGGGGTGGWVGGTGGAGGGNIAANGTSGQGAGGAGATLTAGGLGGAGNSAGSGTSGGATAGGTGGSGSIAGGGGGGGGYFSGGGGGGDSMPSGLDGGGGGGGSSYASIGYTSSVTHASGVKSGNGQLVLTYTYAPTVTTFAPAVTLSNALTANYNLSFSQSVLGLDATDFSFTGTASGCLVSGISGSGANYTITVSGCSDGTVNLNLASDAVTGATAGPAAVATSTTLTLDRVKPTFTITPPAAISNATSLVYSVTADETVTGISASSFTISGASCAIGTVTGSGKNYSVTVTSCAATATVVLSIKAAAASDLAGNTGPLAVQNASTVTVDRVLPTVTSITRDTSSRNGLQVYNLSFSKDVTGLTTDVTDLVVAGAGCAISKLNGSGSAYQIWVTGCNDGTKTSLAVKASSVVDTAGNIGPIADVTSTETTVDEQLPRATFAVDARAAQTASPSFTVTFSEPVTGLAVDTFTQSGTAKNCSFALTEVTAGLVYRVTTTNCSAGTIKLSLPANSVMDSSGNLGPSLATDSALVIIDSNGVAGGGASLRTRLSRSPSASVSNTNLMQAVSLQTAKQFQQVASVVTSASGKRAIALAGLPLIAISAWWLKRSAK